MEKLSRFLKEAVFLMKIHKFLEFCGEIPKASNTDQDSWSQVFIIKEGTDFLTISNLKLMPWQEGRAHGKRNKTGTGSSPALWHWCILRGDGFRGIVPGSPGWVSVTSRRLHDITPHCTNRTRRETGIICWTNVQPSWQHVLRRNVVYAIMRHISFGTLNCSASERGLQAIGQTYMNKLLKDVSDIRHPEATNIFVTQHRDLHGIT